MAPDAGYLLLLPALEVAGEAYDEIQMTLGLRLYRLRLTAGAPQLCDAVVTLHHEG